MRTRITPNMDTFHALIFTGWYVIYNNILRERVLKSEIKILEKYLQGSLFFSKAVGCNFTKNELTPRYFSSTLTADLPGFF